MNLIKGVYINTIDKYNKSKYLDLYSYTIQYILKRLKLFKCL